MTDPSEPIAEPANLRFLRILVTTLTAVMICGLLVIVALFVIRFSTKPQVVPDSITLPDGTKATAFTMGTDWYGVVTDDDSILIFDRSSGDLRQTITLK
ncbi:MAG: hypothetical protein ACI92Z_002200 [Paracoccaceae bacterium]|jgi:hypothetical protein